MSNCEVFDFELCDIEIRTDQSKSRSERPSINPRNSEKNSNGSLLGTFTNEGFDWSECSLSRIRIEGDREKRNGTKTINID